MGVNNGAKMVAIEVRVRDKATFALAKYDMTFEAKPHGIQPTRMMPAAISVGKSNNLVNPHPTKGIMVNWKKTPRTTALGERITSAKSPIFIVDPIPNMMICRRGMMKILNLNSPIPTKGSGKMSVKMTAAMMLNVNSKPFIAGFCNQFTNN
jgi:hypothetical protein